MTTLDAALTELVRAIGAKDATKAAALLSANPQLARMSVSSGATREEARSNYFEPINHYVYAGDTALHMAAAAHLPDLVAMLIERDADVAASNRRGAQPLHYAADGAPGSAGWDPAGQAAAITALAAAGADPNAKDKFGMPVASVHFDDHPNDIAMRDHAYKQGAAVYEAVGATVIYPTPPYPSTHNLGTNRMSEKPKDGVVNKFGQAHDVKNLFISDGSQFTSGAACNPTLTIVSLAIRQADHIAGAMQRKEI